MACQVYPYNMRLLQRDLADLRDGGLVAVKYSRKGKGYVKTGIPEFKENVPPRRKAHLRRHEDDFRLGWVDAPDQITDDFVNGVW